MAKKLTKPSDGYFYAKREMVDAIDRRIVKNEESMENLKATSREYHLLQESNAALNNIRDFVRNVMLWDTRKGK